MNDTAPSSMAAELAEQSPADLEFYDACCRLPLLAELGYPSAGATAGNLLGYFEANEVAFSTSEKDLVPTAKIGACEDEALRYALMKADAPLPPPEALEEIASAPAPGARLQHLDLRQPGQHVVKAHGCLYCSKSFSTKSALGTHERTHTGVKPFSCEECGKRFTQKCNLQNHAKTHTGVKDYVCHKAGCGKAFSDPSNLKQHLEKTHGGSKAFCGICAKGLRDTYELKRHLNSGNHRRNAGLPSPP